jgi:glycosyltransferase involved in cell wall biosynthesis
MKIAWMTPFHDKSAIARFSAGIVDALLVQGHEVTVIRSEMGEALAEPPLPTQASLLNWKEKWKQNQFDILVTSIGDHYPFHGGIIEKSEEIHAVGIFHDWWVFSLFQGWMTAQHTKIQGEKLINRLYGPEVLKKYQNLSPDHYFETIVKYFPMTEWMAERLDGALVFSTFYLERVRAACPGPVDRLPFFLIGRPIPPKAAKPAAGTIHLLTFGYVNENKRIESIIRAIGAMPALRNSISYRVAGPVTPESRRRLENLAHECELTSFRLDGRVSDQLLDECLDEADIICCLRYPALEGASGSVLEAMQSERPVIVTDTGCYTDIPDELVLKVNPENEQADLQKHLCHLINEPLERQRIGRLAAAWARGKTDPAGVARSLVAHLEKVIAAQPLLRCGESLGRKADSLGLTPDDPFLSHLASKFEELWKNS